MCPISHPKLLDCRHESGLWRKKNSPYIKQGLFKDIDQQARSNLMSRSQYIRWGMMNYMGRQNLIDPPKTEFNEQEQAVQKLLDIMDGKYVD